MVGDLLDFVGIVVIEGFLPNYSPRIAMHCVLFGRTSWEFGIVISKCFSGFLLVMGDGVLYWLMLEIGLMFLPAVKLYRLQFAVGKISTMCVKQFVHKV